jgi:hypothetical protein
VADLIDSPVEAQRSMSPVAPTVEVRIGTVSVEIHQAPPQPAPLPAPSPVVRSALPRERFSPSRYYLRVD